MCFVAGGNEECMNRSSVTAVEPQSSVPSYFVSSYQVKLQKEVKSTQKQPNCKKGAAHAKKDSMKKVVKSKVAA